jgi:cell division protein FtsQ
VKAVRAAVAVISGAALTVGAVNVWDSPVLDLREVEVGGNHRVEARDVAAASELSARDHLLRISTSSVASHVERSPWVARAYVERILPSKVRITVLERTPAAVVVAGPSSWLVDREGVVLEKVAAGGAGPSGGAGGGRGLPTVAELPVSALVPGGDVGAPPYRQALAVLKSLPSAVRERVAVVRAPSAERISVELSDGPVILYGGAQRLGDKTFAVEALMERAAAEGMALASIDVRVPTRPAIRPR